MRDVWGSELDDQLSDLASEFGTSEGFELYKALTKGTGKMTLILEYVLTFLPVSSEKSNIP